MSGLLALLGAVSGAEAGNPVVFGLLAVLAIGSALAVVLHRNLVVEALFLVIHLLSIAALYVLLHAYFFAALQVLVYAGAILVLIVFVIMLLNIGPESRVRGGLLPLGLAFVMGLLLVVLLGRAAQDFNPAPGGATVQPIDPAFGSVGKIADAMFGPYFFPFEVVSLVLVAGMIGAILLSKRHLEN